MTRRTFVGVSAGLAIAMVVLGFWLAPRPAPRPPALVEPARVSPPGAPRPRPAPAGSAAMAPALPAPGPAGLSAEKAARIEKIKRDYDDVRSKAAADYGAAGAAFPGGLNGFLRQLALLEREKRVDFAAFLTPRELEDFEMVESTSGQMVQRRLGETAADEEQRRMVFRLQREYDDRFALTFDVSPKALWEREAERLQVSDRIRATIGDDLFAAWLRGEGADYLQMAELAAQQQLPASAGIELWRVKTEFTLRRLEINAAGVMPTAQFRAAHAALAQLTELRLMGILGAGTVQLARDGVFQWLPKP